MNDSRSRSLILFICLAALLAALIVSFLAPRVIAWYFGAGAGADAFFVAFRIPNTLRRLLAEGSLSMAFVPVFSECLARRGTEDAYQLARSAFRILVPVLMVAAALGVIFSPRLVDLIAPGFGKFPEKMALTVALTRMLFPYIIFVGILALVMGILNSLGHFAVPALAPVFLNLAMIAAVFFVSPEMTEPTHGLALGVLIGGMLQLVLQVPVLAKRGIRLLCKPPFRHPGLKRVGRLMLPTVLGAAVYQVNVLVGTLLASLLPQGSVSYLYYADRLVQFPLGIFAIAAATAVLPALSRQAAAGDMGALRETFSEALGLVLVITFPAMAGLIVLREPIIAFLFERGAFDAVSTRLTAQALLYYAMGLMAFSAVRVVVSTFYALQDTRTPVWTAGVSVLANVGFGILLMAPLGHGGLALAGSLASMVNLGLLLWVLNARLGAIGIRKLAPSFFRSGIGSCIMGIGVWWVAFRGIPFCFGDDSGRSLELAAGLPAGMILYAIFSRVVRSPELKYFPAFTRKGRFPNEAR